MKQSIVDGRGLGPRDRRPVLRAGPWPSNVRPGDIPGPIDSIQDLQDTAKMLFKMADTNNDGQISQKEATDAGNLLVGGFFFRADANGDGTLSPEEARAAREQLFRQQPLLRYVLEKAKPQNAGDAAAGDGRPRRRPGGPDHRRQPGPGDRQPARHQPRPQDRGLRAAPGGAAGRADPLPGRGRQPGRPAQPGRAESGRRRGGADGGAGRLPDRRHRPQRRDQHGRVRQGARPSPAHAAFRVLDANNDGQISLDELQRAQQIIADQIRRLQVARAPNSLLQSAPERRRRPPTGIGQPGAVPATVRP